MNLLELSFNFTSWLELPETTRSILLVSVKEAMKGGMSILLMSYLVSMEKCVAEL